MKDRCGCVFASFSSRSVWIAFRRKTDRRQQMYPHFNFRNHCQTFSYENSFHTIFVARTIFLNFFFFSSSKPFLESSTSSETLMLPIESGTIKGQTIEKKRNNFHYERDTINFGISWIWKESVKLISMSYIVCVCVCARKKGFPSIFCLCFHAVILWRNRFMKNSFWPMYSWKRVAQAWAKNKHSASGKQATTNHTLLTHLVRSRRDTCRNICIHIFIYTYKTYKTSSEH